MPYNAHKHTHIRHPLYSRICKINIQLDNKELKVKKKMPYKRLWIQQYKTIINGNGTVIWRDEKEADKGKRDSKQKRWILARYANKIKIFCICIRNDNVRCVFAVLTDHLRSLDIVASRYLFSQRGYSTKE